MSDTAGRVLVTVSEATEGIGDLDALTAAGLEYVHRPELGSVDTDETLRGAFDGYWAVIAANEPYTRAVLESAPDLRVIARPGVGYDGVDVQAATDHGVVAFTTPGINHHAVADFTLTMTLATLNRIPAWDRAVRVADWHKEVFNRQLEGATVGVVGLGFVGRAVAERLSSFGCRLLAVEPAPDADFCKRFEITLLSLDEMLSQVDVLILTTALTPETRGLIGRRELALMPSRAILVNTSRGGVVDQPALVEALQTGVIDAAALDVYESEPLPADDPLTGLPNVLLSPHVASRTYAAAVGMMNAAIGGVVDLSRGQAPAHGRILNPDVGSLERFRVS